MPDVNRYGMEIEFQGTLEDHVLRESMRYLEKSRPRGLEFFQNPEVVRRGICLLELRVANHIEYALALFPLWEITKPKGMRTHIHDHSRQGDCAFAELKPLTQFMLNSEMSAGC
jgi:hypothetical protein